MPALPRSRSSRSRLSAVLLAAFIAACGGAGGDTSTVATAPAATTAAGNPTTTAPSGTTAATPGASTATAATTDPATTTAGVKALSAAAAQWLDLDLDRLAAFAAPVMPAHYRTQNVTALDNTPVTDPITDRIATLGRVLFHDPRLSTNDAVACSSCHLQANGFDDPGRLSTGVLGVRFVGTLAAQFTTAHAMRLGNLRYYEPGSTFWDKRASSVEVQATQPIQHPVEMGFDAAHGGLGALLTKMAALPYYPELFEFAFGDAAITEVRMQRALAQFERAMISSGSAWDTAYARTFDASLPDRGLSRPLPELGTQQDRGRKLFMDPPNQGGLGCAGCHVPPTFALAANSRSNGLDAGETRVFKSPSLKNVGLSQAFMHDGRLATIEQVIDHYDSGVQDGPALDNRLRQPGGGPPRRLNLSVGDKAALAAFLRTLTDTAFVADPKFASPFRK
ncbi:MAG: cytochrome-c peroxidase [Burkholderiaceae bacterium]